MQPEAETPCPGPAHAHTLSCDTDTVPERKGIQLLGSPGKVAQTKEPTRVRLYWYTVWDDRDVGNVEALQKCTASK